jgi:hypothetical protein
MKEKNMSVREKLRASSSLKKNLVELIIKDRDDKGNEIEVGNFGRVLFIEPSIPDLNSLRERTLKVKSQTMDVDQKKKDDATVHVEFDVENSRSSEYQKGLVMLTAWEEDAGEKIFPDKQAFAEVFGDEGGAQPKHGNVLFSLFLRGAQSVTGEADLEEEKKSS